MVLRCALLAKCISDQNKTGRNFPMPVNVNASKASVLVVDDHPLFRHGVILLIDRQTDLYCCGEADSVASAQAAVAAKKPRVVLLDLRLGNEDGVELIKALKARFAFLHILV